MPELERIQQLTPGTISQQWYENGVAVDPGTVTVGITRWDGTTLVAAGTPTGGSGTAARTFNLTTTHTALLDRLTVTWTSTSKGTMVSYVEVAGGFLCSLAEIQALFPTAADPNAIRTGAEQRLEWACGRAFVPRYARETLDGSGALNMMPRWPQIRAIRAVTMDGATVAASSVSIGRSVIYLSTGWTNGYGNVVVGYEHGQDFPGEDIRKAVLLAAQETYTTASDGRVVRREADGQAVTYASPSSAGGFMDPLLRSIVRDHDLNIGIA